MISTYMTKQGDMWDQISYNLCDSAAGVIPLMQANPEYTDTYIFPAGIELIVPEFDAVVTPEIVPPWAEE